MAFIKEAYSESRVDMIYELLKRESDSGSPKDYEITIDGLKVVSRNNDPERFYDFEQFVLPESKTITINVHERSHRSLKYILLLSEEEQTPEGLSGIERSISLRMQQEKTKWSYKRLEEDYEQCQQRLRECEEHNRDLQDRLHTMEAEKSNSSGQLTSALIGLAGTVISSNPGALSGIPIIGSMFGKGKTETAHAELAGPKQPCLCSSASQTFTGELTVGDDQLMKVALVPYFKEEYREKVMNVIQYLFHYNHFIDQALGGIKAALKREKQQNEQTVKN